MTNEERAALIAQGWTPPVAVDPDFAEAETLWLEGLIERNLALAGIKRGRALAAAEAKPGLVWVKHDYSSVPPRLGPGANVATICDGGHFNATSVGAIRDWTTIEYYMWIEWPEDYEQ